MGRSRKTRKCPRCSGNDVILQDSFGGVIDLYLCVDCDYDFKVSSSRSRKRDVDDEFDDCDGQEFTEDGTCLSSWTELPRPDCTLDRSIKKQSVPT